jgi:hypothetical protein
VSIRVVGSHEGVGSEVGILVYRVGVEMCWTVRLVQALMGIFFLFDFSTGERMSRHGAVPNASDGESTWVDEAPLDWRLCSHVAE